MAAQHGPVGMVGPGNMGGRMTRRMVEAGLTEWGGEVGQSDYTAAQP
jgi:3-hydroxyisobutyrate dehydrogenase-like beta-hydroxyacid dehydrogenase